MTFKKKIFVILCGVCLLGITLFYPLANADSTYQWQDNTNQYQEQFNNDPSYPSDIPDYELPNVIDIPPRTTRYDGMYYYDYDSQVNEYIYTYLHLDKNAGKMMFIFQFASAYDMSDYNIYIRDEIDNTFYPGINRNQASQVDFFVSSCEDITFGGATFFDIPYIILSRAEENLPLPSKTTTTGYFYRDNVNYRVVIEWDLIQTNPVESGMDWDITLFNYTLFTSYNFDLTYYLVIEPSGGGMLYNDRFNLLLDFSANYVGAFIEGYEYAAEQAKPLFKNVYKEGYHTGYVTAVNQGITSNWFTGFFDGMQGFLNIKFGQISIGSIILIPLSITIVWFIIRQFRGGGGGD